MSGFAQITEQIDNELEVNLGKEVYRDITWERRSVFELNGTQWGELSERVVIDSDVEIEWFGTWPGVDGGWFFADTSDDDQNESRFLTNGSAISGFGFPSATALSTIPAASVIHRYQYIRTGNSVGFYVNGNLLATTSYSGQLSFNSLFTKWASSSGIPKFSGIFYDLKIWTNGDRNAGDLIDIPFNEQYTDYQRNRAVLLGGELYSDSFALPEFFSRDGNIITKTDTTSETIFIANVEAGKQYKLSFRKDSHSTGSPNLRDQFNNRYIFPLMSTLESSGKTYEFVFTATTGGQVGINGSASLWSVSDLSIREWSGVILQNALPEHWLQIERKRYWDYWLGVQNLFGPTSDGAVPWTYDGNGTYTKDSDTWGRLGENFGNVSVPGTYQVGFNYSGSGLRLYTQNPAGGNQFLAVPDAGRVLWDYVVPKVGLWFDSNIAIGAEISNISFRRKLEIAQ